MLRVTDVQLAAWAAHLSLGKAVQDEPIRVGKKHLRPGVCISEREERERWREYFLVHNRCWGVNGR